VNKYLAKIELDRTTNYIMVEALTQPEAFGKIQNATIFGIQNWRVAWIKDIKNISSNNTEIWWITV
jgi:hypothetical protein